MNENAECNSPALNAAVDNVVQVFKSQAEEVIELDQKKWTLEAEIENMKKIKQQLEMEKNQITDRESENEKMFTADISRLKLRNAAYQKEHVDLRNAITIIRYQIEKIKDGIATAKANDLKALEEFERAVDEITEKFRSGPDNYDRKCLSEKIEKEKAKRDILMKKFDELTSSFENFNKANGLRMRKDENEELINCILPESMLSCYVEMTKTLDEVICGMKNLTNDSQQDKRCSKTTDSRK